MFHQDDRLVFYKFLYLCEVLVVSAVVFRQWRVMNSVHKSVLRAVLHFSVAVLMVVGRDKSSLALLVIMLCLYAGTYVGVKLMFLHVSMPGCSHRQLGRYFLTIWLSLGGLSLVLFLIDELPVCACIFLASAGVVDVIDAWIKHGYDMHYTDKILPIVNQNPSSSVLDGSRGSSVRSKITAFTHPAAIDDLSLPPGTSESIGILCFGIWLGMICLPRAEDDLSHSGNLGSMVPVVAELYTHLMPSTDQLRQFFKKSLPRTFLHVPESILPLYGNQESWTSDIKENPLEGRAQYFMVLFISEFLLVAMLLELLRHLSIHLQERPRQFDNSGVLRRVTWTFTLYYTTLHIVLYLICDISVQRDLIGSDTGLDWELWWMWISWILGAQLLSGVLTYTTTTCRHQRPSVLLMLQLLPVLGNEIHIVKDHIQAALFFSVAYDTEDGLLRHICFSLAYITLAFLYLHLPLLFMDEVTTDALKNSHLPIVFSRPISDINLPGEAGYSYLNLFAPLIGPLISASTHDKFVKGMAAEAPFSFLSYVFAYFFRPGFFEVVLIISPMMKVIMIPIFQRKVLPALIRQNGCGIHDFLSYARGRGRTSFVMCVLLEYPDFISPLHKHEIERNVLNRPDDARGFTALHHAALKGSVTMLNALLEVNASTQAGDHNNDTALHIAIGAEQQACVEILAFCTDMQASNNAGDTVLHTATNFLQENVVELLIRARALMNAQNKEGNTALHCAVNSSWFAGLKLLLEAGTDVHIRNQAGASALQCASADSGNSALHTVVAGNWGSGVTLLIDAKMDVHAQNKYGNSALHIAALNSASDTAELLLLAGTDVGVLNSEDASPLDLAMEFKDLKRRKLGGGRDRQQVEISISEENVDAKAKTINVLVNAGVKCFLPSVSDSKAYKEGLEELSSKGWIARQGQLEKTDDTSSKDQNVQKLDDFFMSLKPKVKLGTATAHDDNLGSISEGAPVRSAFNDAKPLESLKQPLLADGSHPAE